MYPGKDFNFYALFRVFDESYWPIFGEVEILGQINECLYASDCETRLDVYFAYFFIIFYMIISSVLLLNLLIAMFTYAFEIMLIHKT